ncbi:glioma pathogenesis-related protein 1-like [Discoglossus pictus]
MFSLLPVLLGLFSAVAGIPEDFEDAFIKEAVDAHNAVRSKVKPTAKNMLYMSWDPALAAVAAQYITMCAFTPQINMVINHPAFKDYGQNLFKDPDVTKIPSITAVVNAWAVEAKNYNFEGNTCVPSGECSKYTQIIWARSYKFGCARNLCQSYYLVICNYGPGGNKEGKRPFNDGAPCSGCGTTDTCNNNLCMNPKRDKSVEMLKQRESCCQFLTSCSIRLNTILLLGAAPPMLAISDGLVVCKVGADVGDYAFEAVKEPLNRELWLEWDKQHFTEINIPEGVLWFQYSLLAKPKAKVRASEQGDKTVCFADVIGENTGSSFIR